jgi:hypothetical protein
MKIVKKDEFKRKVEIIINALLSHDITREHTIECLSSVVIASHDSATKQAVEQIEDVLTRHRNDAGIDLKKLVDIGVRIGGVTESLPQREELEFELLFGTESLPFVTEDVSKRWRQIAFPDEEVRGEVDISNPTLRRTAMVMGPSKAFETWAAGLLDDVLDVPSVIEQGDPTT